MEIIEEIKSRILADIIMIAPQEEHLEISFEEYENYDYLLTKTINQPEKIFESIDSFHKCKLRFRLLSFPYKNNLTGFYVTIHFVNEVDGALNEVLVLALPFISSELYEYFTNGVEIHSLKSH